CGRPRPELRRRRVPEVSPEGLGLVGVAEHERPANDDRPDHELIARGEEIRPEELAKGADGQNHA
ncbi:MAG: hypothetical protein AVDCRST_MAG87-2365, partial [uncultured Thermomicrobiales bacterium]